MAKPHRNTMAMQAPANPIIEPIERSNSPAIISKPAPSAMMPSCAMTRRLLRMPRALKPLSGERVERKLTGWNGEVTEHAKKQKHHPDRADFRPCEE